MKLDNDKCCYCGGCVGVCPENALELRETQVYIKEDDCKGCGICIQFCPVGALTKDEAP